MCRFKKLETLKFIDFQCVINGVTGPHISTIRRELLECSRIKYAYPSLLNLVCVWKSFSRIRTRAERFLLEYIEAILHLYCSKLKSIHLDLSVLCKNYFKCVFFNDIFPKVKTCLPLRVSELCLKCDDINNIILLTEKCRNVEDSVEIMPSTVLFNMLGKICVTVVRKNLSILFNSDKLRKALTYLWCKLLSSEVSIKYFSIVICEPNVLVCVSSLIHEQRLVFVYVFPT